MFDTFKKCKGLAENKTGKRLKCLISDNGGKYCSKDFDRYYSHNGICREKTVLGTPQENRVLKWMKGELRVIPRLKGEDSPWNT